MAELVQKNDEVDRAIPPKLMIYINRSKEDLTRRGLSFRLFYGYCRGMGSVEVNSLSLTSHLDEEYSLLVIPSIDYPFTKDECSRLLEFVRRGGCMIIGLHEFMRPAVVSSVNFLLEEFGISVCDLSLNHVNP